MNRITIRRPNIPQELRDRVKERLADEGICISAYAKERGLAPRHAYDFLNGRTSGVSGESRRAAIIFGLWHGVIEERAAS